MSGRWASWLMRSLPRMNLTSSVMRASLLAQPGIDDGLSAFRRAGVEHVPDHLLLEPDQRYHDLVVGREVVECLQERDRDLEELAAMLFGVGEPAVELVCPVDDHAPSMSSS